MPACLEAAAPIAPNPPIEACAAHLMKFSREQLIVDYLNRGVSVAEIAARLALSEKRTRAVIREILARRMPHAPDDFVAIQVSRLNEALLVAYSAMSATNLKAVDQVVKIVRELDRYHGFFAAARRRAEPTRLDAPTASAEAYGAALVCQARFARQIPMQELEKIDFTPGQIAPNPAAQVPLAPLQRGEGRGEGPGRLAADARPAPHPGLLPVNGEKGSAGALADDDRP